MPQCTQCGVEVGGAEKCPLCGSPVQGNAPAVGKSGSFFPDRDMPPAAQDDPETHDGKRMFWMLCSVILATAFVINCAIIIMTPSSFVWVKYVLASLIAVWISISLLLFSLLHPALNAGLFFIAAAAYLFLLDWFDGSITWFFPLGTAILSSFSCISLAAVLAIKYAKEKGFNVFAFIFLSAGLFCICVDAAVAAFPSGSFRLTWSLIVLASVLPVSVFLLYLHYRLKKKFPFARIFHI